MLNHDTRRKILREEFLENWDWSRVFDEWHERLRAFAVSLDGLFAEVVLHDPQNPSGRRSEASWWPTNRFRELHLQAQEHFDRWPGTQGQIHPNYYYVRRGELDTLQYLWEVRRSDESICALLLTASLFSRLHSSRAHYPRETWPPFFCTEALDEIARTKLAEAAGLKFDDWHYSCTEVLPTTSDDYVYRIDSMEGLVRYLAEEHAALLLSVRPVQVVFAKERDPFIASLLRDKRKAEGERQKKTEVRLAAENDEAERTHQERLAKHPRFGEFDDLTKMELEVLVWSKPTREIADEFGISDVAIGKRCRRDGIQKPTRGFWAKVKAGKVPHPKGKPVK